MLMPRRLRAVALGVLLCLLAGLVAAPALAQDKDKAVPKPAQPKLFVTLTGNYNTPDGMALLPNGDFILSVPNFNDLTPGSFLVRVSADNKVSEFLKLPDHPVTGKPVGALGVCLAPSGDLFLSDYQATGERQSRVLRIVVKDGKAVDVKPVVTGLHVANAVICHGGYLWVSDTQIDKTVKPGISGVVRFKLDELAGDPVQLGEDETKDPHFVGVIEIHDPDLPLGADGLCFDKQGNLYIGNFADGTVHRMTFGSDGKLTSNKIFARADFMKSSDGLTFDPQTGVIYVADSRQNAIQMVLPNGTVKTLAKSGDTDGSDGGMDQPCEALLRGRELIVSNMDWPITGTINKKYDPLCTLSVIPLK